MSLETLDDVRAWIEEARAALDPESRYGPELLAVVDGAADVADLEARLSKSSRGLRHSGDAVFARMTLEEKLRANLVTPETSLFRFAEGELEAIDRYLLPHVHGRRIRVLVVPCSHGEEAYTVAAYFTKVGVDFEIDAFDIQPALIEEARSGVLTFGFPTDCLDSPGRVSQDILDRIRFEVGDAHGLPIPAEPAYDVVLCRNFLGYFVRPVALALATLMTRRVLPGGVLFLDAFVLEKHAGLAEDLEALGSKRLESHPVFVVR